MLFCEKHIILYHVFASNVKETNNTQRREQEKFSLGFSLCEIN
jgi:hypothetical protein